MTSVPKAGPDDVLGRYREIVSDPLNLLIRRVPDAGLVRDGFVILHNGLRVPVRGIGSYYEQFSDILVINRGVHEPLEEYLFQQVLDVIDEAPVMLELGAYWSHYSMWLKKVRPRANVIMVEPNVKGLLAGSENFTTNGMEGTFFCAQVGHGEMEIDKFLAERGIDRLSILHADIQGAELEMLEGAAAALASKRIDYLFVSTHSQELHQQVRAALERAGYRVEVSSDFNDETTSCDGLVFASSPGKSPVFRDFRPLGRAAIVNSDPAALLQSLARTAG